MEVTMQVVLSVITTVMTGVIGLLFHKFKQREEKREILEQERYLREKAVGNALRALCRDRILQGYINYKQRGGITAPELETINKLYNAYHALGGNGTITAIFEKIIHMPIEED